MRYNAYHSEIPKTLRDLLGYLGGEMDKTNEKRSVVSGDLGVYRVSPYEFCQTAEPVAVQLEGATSLVYKHTQVGADDTKPLIAQSTTYSG